MVRDNAYDTILPPPALDPRHTPNVIEAVNSGRSHRWIACDLGISKNTVGEIIKRHRIDKEGHP